MFKVTVSGDKAVIAKLQAMPQKLHKSLLRAVWKIITDLDRSIKIKLQNVVLRHITGRLQSSIFMNVLDNGTVITGTVGQDARVAPYGRIHELGGTTRPHDIRAKNGKALMFSVNGKNVFARSVHHPGSRIPARSYMGSSFNEQRDAIRGELREAVREGIS